ncbi:formyltetrahydrofolate deformylase [Thalassospira profundimaris]|uniref:Formyltetrahydrofolate deformylase n=1 Tax=Thalassospira profundimaris TaxID=502049 RepID=A0A367WKG5_9PROT|nr:formyltetrahydrofolate deformylase [Thalassospira profundimaris]RCK41923.1 formyltetrahydrofolate deformylase [Thalassospira profundimaris]
MSELSKTFILTITCPDTFGIVASVTSFLADEGAFVTKLEQFGDPESNRFFMRVKFDAGRALRTEAEFVEKFTPIGERFSMDWKLHDYFRKPRVILMVSKFGHCLHDILHRVASNNLGIDIPAVVSNHEDMRGIVEWNGIPYYHLPVNRDNKAAQEGKLLDLIGEHKADLVGLARYMQVLSTDLCQELEGRCINIHHSFLPSFKGAKPYHQAHKRGVKLIGGTAHYVTADLDEGPIIHQAVERVDHTMTAEDMVEIGRDIESVVFSRAIQMHCEHRVFRNGSKTVIFRR